jgi:hypothetical protein
MAKTKELADRDGKYVVDLGTETNGKQVYSPDTLSPTSNTVAQIRSVGENITPVNVFCILKHDLTQRVMNGLVSWKVMHCACLTAAFTSSNPSHFFFLRIIVYLFIFFL